MGPHDLLCKWCSTFVGKDKQFCSLFCESRHTRSKRRKLAYKRPVKSSGPEGNQREYISPRTNKTAPSKKQFLEDVITAMTMEDHSSKDKGRNPDTGNDDTKSKNSQTSESSNIATPRKSAIPRLDLDKLREKNGKQANSAKHVKEIPKPEYKLKSKTHTIFVHKKKDADIESRKNVTSSAKKSAIKDSSKPEKSRTQAEISAVVQEDKKQTTNNTENKTATDSKTMSNMTTAVKDSTLSQDNTKSTSNTDKNINNDTKTTSKTDGIAIKSSKTEETPPKDVADDVEKLPRQQSKIATELANRVRSSGYGAPVNPKLRPVSLKPRSANMASSKVKRESSASSSKSMKIGVDREKSRSIFASKNQSKWELVQKPIKEEYPSKEVGLETEKTNSTLEHEDPSPKTSTTLEPKGRINQRRPLQSIEELLREESTGSILDPSVLQQRLSSIKKKVEVRKRGRDSRSSLGSDLDSTLDTSFDATYTSRDKLNTSLGDTKTAATSARTSTRDSEDLNYCQYCRRTLYYSDIRFCSRACENRHRQLSWKSAHIEVPTARRNRYAWGQQKEMMDDSPNYMNYIPSWEIYGK